MPVLMRNKFGDEVQIPDGNVQVALNSGYVYVNPPAQPAAGKTTTVLNQQTGLLEKVPVSQPVPVPVPTTTLAAPASPANKFAAADNGGKMKVYGPDVAAAEAAGYTILYGSDLGSSWPSATITKATSIIPSKPDYTKLPEFLGLSSDDQKLIKSLFTGFTEGREDEIEKALPAIIEQAKASVEPFAKAKLSLTLGEVQSKIALDRKSVV